MEPYDRILGVDAQLIFSWVIQLGNTLILVFILYKLLYGPVINFLDERKARIAENIENANKLLKEAEEMKTSYTGKLAEIDTERAAIISEANQRAKEIEESIVKAAKEEAIRIKENAAREIQLQKDKAQRDMRDQIIDISALIAGKYLETTIDQETQIRLLDRAIEDLGDATWLS